MSRLDKFCLPDSCMLSFNPRKAKMTSTETEKQYKQWFKKIKLGSPIIHKGVAVYPIFSEITSKVCLPMEPVDPSIAISFIK